MRPGLRTLIRLSGRRKALVAEAVARLAIARIALALFPFRRVVKRLGVFVSPDDPRVVRPIGDATSPEARTARDIGWAVRAVAPRLPFKAVCLQQALAAHAMLRARGVAATMHLGAGSLDEVSMDAHAWLDAAGVRVAGYPIAQHIREIGCFV